MKHEQNPKYISYVLSTFAAQQQKSAGKIKSKVVHSSIPALKAIPHPAPTPARPAGNCQNIG
jgi:type I restriction enzyme S subunit